MPHRRPLHGYLLMTALLLGGCGDNTAGVNPGGASGDPVPPGRYVFAAGDLGKTDAWLFDAASAGDMKGLEQALEAGGKVNALDNLKRPPLFAAAFYNRTGTANILLAHGADVGIADFTGFTALHASVAAGGLEVASALIAKGVSLNARAAGGRTALHLAAATNQATMVKLLLENGASAQAKDNEGLTPAALAAANGHTAVSAQIKRWTEAHNPKHK
jgi:ankyrin repeat protein